MSIYVWASSRFLSIEVYSLTPDRSPTGRRPVRQVKKRSQWGHRSVGNRFPISHRSTTKPSVDSSETSKNDHYYFQLPIIIHEMMHVLGFAHEHARSDRDSFVTVHMSKIGKSHKYDFKKLRTWTNTSYDLESTMHYPLVVSIYISYVFFQIHLALFPDLRILKASAHSFKRFTSQLLKLSFSLYAPITSDEIVYL